MCDFFSGICDTMNISLTLTAAGQATTSHTVTKWNDGTTKFTRTFDQVSQPASVTGSITYGGVEYAQGHPVQSGLGSFKDRIVAVTK